MGGLRAFAEASYARPGVATVALQLQDEWGADINLLLTAAWLAQRGERLTPAVARALVADCRELREQLIAPQRAVRRALKHVLPALYAQALALEVAMELAQLDRIEQGLAQQPPERTEATAASLLLAENLREAFSAAATPRSASAPVELLARLHAALAAHATP